MIGQASAMLVATLGIAAFAAAAEPATPPAAREPAPLGGAEDTPPSAAETATEQARHADILRSGGPTIPGAPESMSSRFARAVALTAEGKSGEAEAIYRALIAESPELPEPHNNLAVLLARRGQLDGARAELETAVAVAPTYATALENLGDVHARLALAAYRRAAGARAGASLRAKLRQAELLAAQALAAPSPVAPAAPSPGSPPPAARNP